ncbi:MAG: hypothetical protein RLY93_12160 [Sumerlaeia bacterium]
MAQKEQQCIVFLPLEALATYWEEQSCIPENASHLAKYLYTRPHASRARKWLAYAMGWPDGPQGGKPASHEHWLKTIPLSGATRLPIEETAQRARAHYLCATHGLAWPDALEGQGTRHLDKGARRGANNVAESVRRFLHFASALAQQEQPYDPGTEDGWPPAISSRNHRYKKGMQLYRKIVRVHRLHVVSDPKQATADSIAEASRSYRDQAANTAGRQLWNRMVAQLKEAAERGHLPGIGEELLSQLTPVYTQGHQPKAPQCLTEQELIALWPEHFQPAKSDPGKVSLESGLHGFFNRHLPPGQVRNAAGNVCPKKNLKVTKSLKQRGYHLRRYVWWWREKGALAPSLESLLEPEKIRTWLLGVAGKERRVSNCDSETYGELFYTARYYFEHDTEALKELAETEMTLPSPNESDRGREAVKRLGSPAMFLEIGEALGHYADHYPRLNETRSSGHYLPAKGYQVHLSLRLETGLRPGAVSLLRYFDHEPDEVLWPSIFPGENACYQLAIPRRDMKQHKKALILSERRPCVKPYRFFVIRPETARAMREYLESWHFAEAVLAKRTNCLFLTMTGEPFKNLRDDAFMTSFRDAYPRIAAYTRGKTDQTLPVLKPYDHRHVMGEFLARHMPGGKLKTWYLTHHIDKGSDRHYGDQDAAFLRQCVSDVLDGVPPLHEQERQHLESMKRREAEREERDRQALENQGRLADQLGRLLQQNADKDALISQLSTEIAHLRSQLE